MKRFLAFLIGILLMPQMAFADPTVEAAANNAGAETDTSITVSITTPNPCTDCIVLFACGSEDSVSVSSATYAGNGLTEIDNHIGNAGYITFWVDTAPTVGANNFVANFSGGLTGNGGWCGGLIVSGVDQSTPTSNWTQATGSSEDCATAVSSASGKLVLGACTIVGFRTPVANTGDTERWNNTAQVNRGAGSTQAGDTSVTVGFGWATEGNAGWVFGGVSINEASAAAAVLKRPAIVLE